MIFASIPFPCATDHISQYHQIRKNFSFAATVSTSWDSACFVEAILLYLLQTQPVEENLPAQISIMELLSTGWQRLAPQASVPNSIPPEGLQAMVGSIFSSQPITFTQNDFYFTFAIRQILCSEVMISDDNLFIKRGRS